VQTPSFHPTRTTPKLRATWLGHACYYVEFPGGLRVLFDPVFEDCCAPVNLKGLRRFTPPPCEIEDLPVVDIVVISHNHYDHLSYPTILRIQKKWPDAHFFAPLGNKIWFEKCGITQVTELDWWETREVMFQATNSVGSGKQDRQVSASSSPDDAPTETISATIGALPCQHITARTPFDKCKTLWASWSVESGGSKLWFAGSVFPPPRKSHSLTPTHSDTGYRTVPALPAHIDDYSSAYAHLPICPAFAQIGLHRGPFDLGLIPIGAYAPRAMFSAMHADPKDAVNIFLDTRCKRALGMHWGTWVLTEEDVLEPPRKLAEALEWKGLEKGVFAVTAIGEGAEVESGEGGKES
jgi:N-acyl-phosphatidylethanolamine-hydrolysing phospholipase D